jgi:uncharacterized protein (DUF4415 family)
LEIVSCFLESALGSASWLFAIVSVKAIESLELFQPAKQIKANRRVIKDRTMRSHYDSSKLKAKRNPYIKYLKQPVTIRLDKESIAYFQALAAETGLPYQQLINLYLRDCASNKRKLSLKWIE